MRFVLIGYDENGNKYLDSKCFYCKCRLTKKTKTRDHVIPKSKGGMATVPCCRKCNQLKADMSAEEFIKKISNTV